MRSPMAKDRLLSSGAPRELPRKGAREAREALSNATSRLPQWETFALPDRLRLVGLLIQTARRQVHQVPPGATARASAEQG